MYFSIAFYKYIFNFAVSRNEKGTKSPIGPRQYVEQLKKLRLWYFLESFALYSFSTSHITLKSNKKGEQLC